MLIVFVKSQLQLLDAPVHVAAHVRKDGTVVQPHVRIQKVAMKQRSLFGDHPAAPEPQAKPKRAKLDTFIERKGGVRALGKIIASMTNDQQLAIFEQMGKLDGKSAEDVAAMFADHYDKPADKGETPDLFAEPAAKEQPAATKEQAKPEEPAPQHELVEHVTGKGKTLRGVVRTDLDGHAAAAIDPYTFRKNGGWFIREKYLTGEAAAAPAKADTPPEAEKRVEVRANVDKSKQQAAKLREGGEKLLADAQADYGRDRNANTARRARMADGAEADAAKRIRTAKTMINIANAIEDGEARYLTGVSTRAAVETLEHAIDRAMIEADRHLSYHEQQQRKGRDLEPEDLQHAVVPRAKWGTGGSDPAKVIEALKGKKGGPALAAEIRRSPYITPDLLAGLKKHLSEKDLSYHLGWWNIESVARQSRLERIGIKTDNDLRLALAEMATYRDGHRAVDPVKAAERALVGKKVGIDFFPTPKTLAATMAQLAGIKPGMKVLEPSAGNGHLADAARDAGGEVHAVEISDTLRNVLEAKKHTVVAHDFEAYQPIERYDAVLMNPPFSNRMDAAHIQRAWDMLKPGGKLVAIAGEGVFLGSDAKARDFRAWLDANGAEVEHLPANTFKGADLPAQTGANARLIVLEKPAEVADVADTGPKEGDVNAEGLVFRDGRWHREDVPAADAVPAPSEPAPPSQHTPDVEAAEDREDLATELARNPHSEKAKRMIADVGHRAASNEEPAEPDADSPSSGGYRYADTGYIAGSRKEMAAAQVIRRARADGAQVLITGLDWEQLEANPREAKELITKSNLFGTVPWDALRDGGMEPGAGFLVDRIYAAVGTEPTDDNPQARRDYTLGLQTLRERLEACKTPNDVSDVLDRLREEYDGKMLTAAESEKYQAFSKAANEAYLEHRKIDQANSALYSKMNATRGAVSEAEWSQTKRERRGWKRDPEIDARLPALREAAAAAEKEWGDALQATRARMDELDGIRRDAYRAQEMIQLLAMARNKLDNPLHRAWTVMGERFVNVLRFRSYKGSDAFAKHVAAAKSGKVTDWAWMEKEVTRTPKISKSGARFQLKVADSYQRVGGRDVRPDSTMALKEMFGLRDVQSGNWVLNDVTSAKFHVENCAAAFADLADLLGVPDSMVSFNGRLAMAFGARGQGAKGFKGGAARADYNPVHRVINLTKMGGGGCLAHEWWHAIDNMVKEAEGGGDSGVDDYASRVPELIPAGELREAFKALQSAMLEGTQQATESVAYTAHDVKVARHNLTGAYVNSVGKLILSAGDASAAIAAIDKHFGVDGERKLAPKTKKLVKDWTRIAVAHYGGNPDGGELVVRAGPAMSSYALEAAKLDQGGTAYYSTTEELSARAFQAWVEDRMAGMGRRNDYLSAWADNKYHVDPLFGIEWKPFPEGGERERINSAFDRLFAAMGRSGTLAKAFRLVDPDAGGL